jgi:hypothetical protein
MIATVWVIGMGLRFGSTIAVPLPDHAAETS